MDAEKKKMTGIEHSKGKTTGGDDLRQKGNR
jgi:hypothetical protein